MARTRASAARAAFGRVGTAQVNPANEVSASVSASDNASDTASVSESVPASLSDGPPASVPASSAASVTASLKASQSASRNTGPLAGGRRRIGRPRGPDRRALSIRILAENDDRLTAAVEASGQSPQYIVDAALSAYFDAIGVARRG